MASAGRSTGMPHRVPVTGGGCRAAWVAVPVLAFRSLGRAECGLAPSGEVACSVEVAIVGMTARFAGEGAFIAGQFGSHYPARRTHFRGREEPRCSQKPDPDRGGLVGDLVAELSEPLVGDSPVEPATTGTGPTLLRHHPGDVEVLDNDRATGCCGDDRLRGVMEVVGPLGKDAVVEDRDPPLRFRPVGGLRHAFAGPGASGHGPLRISRRSFACSGQVWAIRSHIPRGSPSNLMRPGSSATLREARNRGRSRRRPRNFGGRASPRKNLP